MLPKACAPAAFDKQTTGRATDGLAFRSSQSLLVDLADFVRIEAAAVVNQHLTGAASLSDCGPASCRRAVGPMGSATSAH